MKKTTNFPPLPDDLILCTTVGLYPNTLHEEGLIAIRKALDTRNDKTISTKSLIELAERVLKNDIFEHKSVFEQLSGASTGTKMAAPYAIIFMESLEEDMLSNSLLKPLVWWRHIDDIFMMWDMGQKSLNSF